MIITVTIMHMMQTSIDKVIGVVHMRNSLMSTTRPVNVISAAIERRTLIRVDFTSLYYMFITMLFVRMMQMSIM